MVTEYGSYITRHLKSIRETTFTIRKLLRMSTIEINKVENSSELKEIASHIVTELSKFLELDLDERRCPCISIANTVTLSSLDFISSYATMSPSVTFRCRNIELVPSCNEDINPLFRRNIVFDSLKITIPETFEGEPDFKICTQGLPKVTVVDQFPYIIDVDEDHSPEAILGINSEFQIHRTPGEVDCEEQQVTEFYYHKKSDRYQWSLNGKKHKVNGPALISGDIQEFGLTWYKNGAIHRSDGKPAIYSPLGEVSYVENGVVLMKYTISSEFNDLIQNYYFEKINLEKYEYRLVKKFLFDLFGQE